jgi:Fur family ferric uptake transcriptional regulator
VNGTPPDKESPPVSCETSVATLVRGVGLRHTQQREAIIVALRHAERHQVARDILSAVQTTQPDVNASTVYRTLTLLRDRGLVSETDLGTGELSYAWVGDDQPHHHLVCHDCRRVIELDHQYLAPIAERLRADFNFEPSLHHFAIFGRCAQCRAADAP